MYMNLNKSVRKIEKYFGNMSKCYQLNMNVNEIMYDIHEEWYRQFNHLYKIWRRKLTPFMVWDEFTIN